MHPIHQHIQQTRRNFLTTSASGIGLAALASLLRDDGLLADEPQPANNPLAPRRPHFAPRAKACIAIFMAGAPSQIDLFDPKPRLNQLHGQPLPESMTRNVRFAFIQRDGARIMGSRRRFTRHGQCGMELSELLPHLGTCADDITLIRSMHTEAFNHHPGQLMMNTGVPNFGRPSMGSWLTYGLGSESQNLPGYVVLTAGRGASGGASNWSSGFMPTTYQGVLFRNQGEPVLNLNNPNGLSGEMQQNTINAIQALNRERFEQIRDPEINSRIASYELAFRMQSAAPELIDLSRESRQTLDRYGVGRSTPGGGGRGSRPDVYNRFAMNCLLARRLVERGVRFVNIYHASWDHHSNLDRELAFNSGMADQPVAALVHDLKQRGMLDDTMVLWMAEFGRTPLGENRNGRPNVTGRDHHPFSFSVWMAGGGVKRGLIYGKSDEFGWGVAENPVHINDYHATILNRFGFNHERLTYRFQGRDFRLTDVAGEVVEPLLD